MTTKSLRYARDMAAQLVGADPTGKPVVHCLRWPGSWNRKAEPRLAKIVAATENAEINLDDAAERLAEAIEAAGLASVRSSQSGPPGADTKRMACAMGAIPNAGTDVHYDSWIRFGYAVHRATAGTGFEIWNTWSKKSNKYNAAETEAAWRRIDHAVTGSRAPRTIGAGTIIFHARAAGWKEPEQEEPQLPPDETDPGYWAGMEESTKDHQAKPTIQVIAGQIDILATQGEDALIASHLPIFQRGDSLMRPLAWEVAASDERSTLAAGLRAIEAAALIDLLNQAANWTRYNARSKGLRPIDPPSSVAAIILSRYGLWRVPTILGVITAPTLRRDGSVLEAGGYDATTRLYHMPDSRLVLPPIISHPTRSDANHALEVLSELLVEFPLVGKVDRAVALSALISPVVRGALSMVPLHAFTAPTAGSGKSYLVDLAAIITTGRICPVATAGRTEEETEKRLGGMLLCGFPIISIDNMSDELAGDLLCQAVERPFVRFRPLGTSNIIEIESRATMFATGNNLTVAGDMTRRTLLGHLDARMERPEERTFAFDPVQRALADRGKYIVACLTIVRAHLQAGSPGKLPQLASFGPWSDLVRSAIVWLDCADPAQSIQEVRRSDPVLDTLRQVMEGWRACFGTGGQTARKVAAAVASFDPSTPEGEALLALRTALAPVASERGQIDAAKLGYFLRKSKDRIVSNWKFTIVAAPNGFSEWAVVKG
jgi:putative DNA primase/helicase